MSNALTSTTRVKDRLKISASTFDTLLTNLIVAVTERLETMCGRSFTNATYTNELHDGSDFYGSVRSILISQNAPISTLTSIEYKAGTNTTPSWTTFDSDTYDVDYDAGLIYFDNPLPQGKRNIRITYDAGWDGFSASISSLWTLNVTPTGTVNGSNASFTLPEEADEVIIYADGVRLAAANVTHTAGSDSVTIAAASVPFSTIAADYKATSSASDATPTLPMELVELCERAVVKLFKQRDSEGKTSESFQESSITWRESLFTKEDMATIKNYRRGYDI